MAEAEAVADSVSGSDQHEPGPIARWLRADPVRAVALALIAVQLILRAEIASRGSYSQDEYVIAARAAGSGLTTDYLFGIFNDHLMPGGLFVAWLITRATGLENWPWVMLLVCGQAILSLTFYRLLRSLLRPGWALLVPLCLFLFSPLTLDATSLWVVGLLLLPVQLAMVLAIAAQLNYLRTGRLRHLIALGLSVVLGLLFDSKALLIVPLVFALTVCFFSRGGPVRSSVGIVRRYWPAWLLLSGLAVAYLAVYSSLPRPPLSRPDSAGQVFAFLKDLLGATLIPGLFGGPWRWTETGDGPPLVAPYEIASWLSWGLLAALIVLTVRRRPAAARAWVLLLVYVALVASLFAATRLGSVLGPMIGFVPRYVADVVLVAALSIGVALLGTADTEDEDRALPSPWPAALRQPGAAAVGYAALVVTIATISVGTLWSTTRFAESWDVRHGDDYLSTTQAELAAAPPGTVFFDQVVPDRVVAGYFWPDNRQSHFFRTAQRRPVFVTSAEYPSVFDDLGRIRPAVVEGRKIPLGDVEGCGHLIGKGETARIPLENPVLEWPWVVYFGYLSSGDSKATFQLGTAVHGFEVRKGLNQIFLLIEGAGTAVNVTVTDPAVTVCTNVITVGKLVPQS
ncbi:MAG TPA: hypothetical protein VFX61_16710 [Micromonosporaceae bacterium]|nr:hypothetical protein [Micromonosporaceae bacterium]